VADFTYPRTKQVIEVTFDEERTSPQAIVKALEEGGIAVAGTPTITK